MSEREQIDALRAQYFAEHPDTTPLSFRCPRCKAEPGEPCTGSERKRANSHLPRQDKHARAFNKRQVAATDFAYDTLYRS